jgi:hypothetical protein
MEGSAAIPLPTQRLSDDVPLLEPIDSFDFDALLAAHPGTAIPLSNPYVASQDIDHYTAVPHNPGVPIIYSPVADTLPITQPESWSMEVGYHTNDPNYSNDHFQDVFYDETTRQYPAVMECTLEIVPSAATSRTDAMKVNGARRQSITPVVNLSQRTGTRAPTLQPMLYPDLMAASLRLSEPLYGEYTEFSSSPFDMFSKFQSHQAPQLSQNHHPDFTSLDEGDFGLFMDPLGFSPTSLHGSTGGLDRFPEQHYNSCTPLLPFPAQVSLYSNARMELGWVDSIPAPPCLPRDEDMSALKYATYDDSSSSAHYGRDIPRTGSPASYGTNEFHSRRRKLSTRTTDSGSTGSGSTGSGSTGSGSTGSGSTNSGATGSGLSSTDFSFARSSGKLLDRKDIPKKPRKLTELGKREYRYTRINGACVGCHLRRKRVSSTALLPFQTF